MAKVKDLLCIPVLKDIKIFCRKIRPGQAGGACNGNGSAGYQTVAEGK